MLDIIAALFIQLALVIAVQAAPLACLGRLEGIDAAGRRLIAQRTFAIEAEDIFKKYLVRALVAMEVFMDIAAKWSGRECECLNITI
jgi:hypothetical protein